MAESLGFTLMHIFQVVCALIVLGLAIWLGATIIRQELLRREHGEAPAERGAA